MNERELINFYLENDILISPELSEDMKVQPLPTDSPFVVINKDILQILKEKKQVMIEDFEKALVLKEKHKNKKIYEKYMEYVNAKDVNVHIDINKIQVEPEIKTQITISESVMNPKEYSKAALLADKEKFLKDNRIKIVSSYNIKSRKWSVQDFVSLYNVRFRELERMLRSRQELQNLTSISRINAKREREKVALIGTVYDKAVTKTGNIMLTVEDPTGMIKVVITKNREELFKQAEETQLDETIGIVGTFDQIIFVSNLFFPDIPLTKELKKSPEEGYFVVIADTEPGSKLFLEKEFNKFLSWMAGGAGTEKQREITSKIKYLFIGGDLVNGVGIYPNQEFDLNIIDIKDQYKRLAELLQKVPSHIPIFICPGNHDVGRISEPQPALEGEYVESLLALPNVISVSNPSMINIYAQPENNFEGMDVMFYHGYSFIYYSENIQSIRRVGGQKRPDLIMKYLLQRRHLAPSHTSTLYIPDPKRDPLVIDKVPDFFISGHVHRAIVSNYKNVTCINASCWTAQSEEQERRGLEAQPARAFLIDMHTREVKIINFLPREHQERESTDNVAGNVGADDG
jgi:DNA polymerase II small subunit